MILQKTIYLIRHGETDYNRQGVVQGSGINSDLNALGRAQAQAFYEVYKHVPFAKVYTSALKRTHQSVKLFLEDGLPWEQHQGLNEISWGEKEGKIPNNVDNLYYKELMESWQNGDVHLRASNGESPIEVLERQKGVIDLIKSRVEEEVVLVAMHGRAMRILLTHLLDRPLHEMDNFEHANLCLYKLTYDYASNKFSLELENNLEHLSSIVH